jgi:hypothetical protein
MERFDELRKEWIVTLKPLKSLSTQALYFLLEPNDDNKFCECVDSFKDCIGGTKFSDFQMLAIEYLLEYKKQNKLKTKTDYYTAPKKWPFGPLDNDQIEQCTKPKTIPNITPDNSCTIFIDPNNSICRCIGCEFYGGFDTCLHHVNLGAITQESLDNCKKHNLLKEKLYGT